MSDTRSTKELFRAWRSGDAEAGQAMAQRFADWYYAISTSRLGEERGRGPCETACARFGEGIVEVTESRALVGWAHEIINNELSTTGGRTTDGDEANPYTGHKKPKGLLVRAQAALPAEIELLEATYGSKKSEQEIKDMAQPLGGMPIGVLKARYTVKKWLKENAGVPFEVTPDKPILDRAPMPLYESGKMATPQEESNFEQWMLTDLDLCKDIAEFAHFAIALRGGLPTGQAAEKAAAAAAPASAKKDKAAASGGGAAGKAAVGGVAVLGIGAAGVLVIAAIAAAAYFYLM